MIMTVPFALNNLATVVTLGIPMQRLRPNQKVLDLRKNNDIHGQPTVRVSTARTLNT
jgi:hypothetical protein